MSRTSSTPGGANFPSFVVLPYLKAWRVARGMTQKELAQKAGCTAVTVRRIEQGRPAMALTAVELARALGVSVDALRSHDPFAEPC